MRSTSACVPACVHPVSQRAPVYRLHARARRSTPPCGGTAALARPPARKTNWHRFHEVSLAAAVPWMKVPTDCIMLIGMTLTKRATVACPRRLRAPAQGALAHGHGAAGHHAHVAQRDRHHDMTCFARLHASTLATQIRLLSRLATHMRGRMETRLSGDLNPLRRMCLFATPRRPTGQILQGNYGYIICFKLVRSLRPRACYVCVNSCANMEAGAAAGHACVFDLRWKFDSV